MSVLKDEQTGKWKELAERLNNENELLQKQNEELLRCANE